jgi:hypothetical protein
MRYLKSLTNDAYPIRTASSPFSSAQSGSCVQQREPESFLYHLYFQRRTVEIHIDQHFRPTPIHAFRQVAWGIYPPSSRTIHLTSNCEIGGIAEMTGVHYASRVSDFCEIEQLILNLLLGGSGLRDDYRSGGA